ncbi:MAG: acetyl/propionyl/methylcrotonyl-CoA carboxylase subunit alpha [Bacteriovoracia bacterium]
MARGKQKLLVANRSEIACRIFQACREMGISTVGIFAPGDEQARHVTYADEVVPVKGYLDVESVMAAAKSTGATLVHPGYGFLSERAHFVEAVEQAGLSFVGPRAETIALMGSKIQAKQLADKNGVPTLPWALVDAGGGVTALRTAAQKVGFPLLLKASSGGGGKGMRRVDKLEDVEAAAESAAAEALSAFGQSALFLEKLAVNPRHIEVQVFGDGQGGGVHLHERECSIQRRHQKIWEESPAPNLPEATRQGLFEAALKIVKATKYRNAGTCEFLVDAQGGFYFLEMNTRLQVEHPVTELVTGLDLVHCQLEQAIDPDRAVLAASPFSRGAAIEVRLYAEDPAQGYIPTPGQAKRVRWPTGPGIRVDSGIEEGQAVGTQFDSMLAKIIVSAPSRAQALARMRFALAETVVHGIGTNLNFLQAIAEHPAVVAGKVDTGFLDRDFADYAPFPKPEELALIAALKDTGLVSSSGMGAGGGDRPAIESPWRTMRLSDRVLGGGGA